MHEGAFYKTLHNFSVHPRRQPNLQLEMGSTCPKDTIDGLTLSAFYPGCSNITAISWFELLRRILPVPQLTDDG